MSGRTGKIRSTGMDALTRSFPENGMKLLLEHPGNVQDLLARSG